MSIISAIVHRFQSAIVDAGEAGMLSPNDWNDTHDVTVDVPGASAFGDTVSEGAATSLARSDHRHSREADPVTAHAAAGDPHTGYRLESADHSHESTGAQAGKIDHGNALNGLTDDDHTQYLKEKLAGGTAAEIPLHSHVDDSEGGAVSGGAVDHNTLANLAVGDVHTQYRLEAADHSHQSTGLQGGQLDHGLALTGLTDDDHTIYLKEKASGGLASEVPEHTHLSAAEGGDIDHAPNDAQYVVAAAHAGLSAEIVAFVPAIGASIPKAICKTADETVNNSATLQDDDHLFFAMAANEVWAFQVLLRIQSGTTPDIKVAFTVPAGAAVTANVPGQFTAAGTLSQQVFLTGGAAVALSGATDFTYTLLGVVINGANAGNLQLQWAQNAINASDTKVLANSYMIATRLA